jgi:hypothetical protein
MEDVFVIKARHGHYEGKGFWWIDHVILNGKNASLMVMFGSRKIGDKACYRIANGPEIFFDPATPNRDDIILQGKGLIREKLKKTGVKAADGSPYDWNSALPR